MAIRSTYGEPEREDAFEAVIEEEFEEVEKGGFFVKIHYYIKSIKILD